MSPFLTMNEEIEQRALTTPVECWFTVAQLNAGLHDSRCWLHLTDMVHRHTTRPGDNAILIQSQEDLYAFSWHKQEAS